MRRPLVAAVGATAVLLVLAVPVLGIKTALPGLDTYPRDMAVMQTYDRIQQAFPGNPIPAVVAVQADDVRSPEMRDGDRRHAPRGGRERRLRRAGDGEGLRGRDRRVRAAADRGRRDRRPLDHGAERPARPDHPGDDRVGRRRERGRHRHHRGHGRLQLPDGVAHLLGVRVRARAGVRAAAGHVPLDRDPAEGDRAEPAVGRQRRTACWCGYSRTATCESLLGFESTGAITSWLPLFLFVVLFGLSMDYHVFILSRIRELVDRGHVDRRRRCRRASGRPRAS